MLMAWALAATISAAAHVGEDNIVGRPDQGGALAASACGQCHALGRRDQSQHRQAPPLRDLHLRYPVEYLEESLAEGIFVGHPDMPKLELTAQQVADFIAYLRSLERPVRR